MNLVQHICRPQHHAANIKQQRNEEVENESLSDLRIETTIHLALDFSVAIILAPHF